MGIDPAMEYVRRAESLTDDPRASFLVADAMKLPFDDRTYDVAVSGLVLNFVPDPAGAVAEQVRVVRPGGSVGAYVWDYGDGLEFLRLFWETAIGVAPGAGESAQEPAFPIATADRLEVLFIESGLERIRVRPIDIDATFDSFDELWDDFLGAARLGRDGEPGWKGPSYDLLRSTEASVRQRIRAEYRARMAVAPSGHVRSAARAWAVCGRRVEPS
jgi:SAM-dependent methyltransferase